MTLPAPILLHALSVAVAADDVAATPLLLKLGEFDRTEPGWPGEPFDLKRERTLGLAELYKRFLHEGGLGPMGAPVREEDAFRMLGWVESWQAPESDLEQQSFPIKIPVLTEPVDGWSLLSSLGIGDSPSGVSREQVLETINMVLPGGLPSDALESLARADFDEMLRGGCVSPSSLHPATIAVNAALYALSVILRLPSPAELKIVAIANDDHGEYRATPDDAVLYAEARRAGWRPALIRNGHWELDGAKSPSSRLIGVARLIWHNFTDRLEEDRLDRVVTDSGWEVLGSARAGVKIPTDGWFAGPQHPVISTSEVRVLVAAVKSSPRSAAKMLSGGRGTGKTTIAQLAARHLHGDQWNLLILRPLSRSLQTGIELDDVIQAALMKELPNRSRKTLVIIEDLRPTDSGAIGDALSNAASATDTFVLGLARYADGYFVEWDAAEVSPLLAIVTSAQVQALAEKLITGYPEVFHLPAGAGLEYLPTMCRGDLRRLVAILRDNGESFEPEHPEVARLRVLAELDEGVPARSLPAELLDVALLSGAQIEAGAIRFLSRPSTPSSEEALVEAITWAAMLEIANAENRALAELLRSTVAIYPELVDTLFDHVHDELQGLLRSGDFDVAVEIVRITSSAAATSRISDLLEILMDRLDQESPVELSTLTKLCRMIDRLSRIRPSWDGTRRFSKWLADERGLAWSLDGSAPFTTRVAAALASLQIRDPAVNYRVYSLSDLIVEPIDPTRGEHLRRLCDLDEALSRCWRELNRRGGYVPQRFDQTDALRQIARSKPGHGFDALIGWLAVNLIAGTAGGNADAAYGHEWIAIIDQHQAQVAAALAGSDAHTVATSLVQLAGVRPGFANKLFNTLRKRRSLVADLQQLILKSPVSDGAHLIRVLSDIHFQVARTVLFTGAVPEIEFASKLAKTIRETDDIKGAGLILTAVAHVDDHVAIKDGTFGGVLAEKLDIAFVRRALQRENRPAALLHLLRGLWHAEASYRNEFSDVALSMVIGYFERPVRNIRHSFAPQLGILLGSDEILGTEALEVLRDGIPEQRLVDVMTAGFCSLDNLCDVHRLARALYPSIGFSLLASRPTPSTLFRTWRGRVAGQAAAGYLRQLAKTLEAGGEPDPAGRLLSWLLLIEAPHANAGPSRPTYWSSLLWALRSQAGHAASVLAELSLFDERLAEQVLDGLCAEDDEGRTSLYGLLAEASSEPIAFAEYLSSIERIRPGMGREITNDLSAPHWTTLRTGADGSAEITVTSEGSLTWDRFIESFSYLQDPAQQAMVGLRLSRLGFNGTDVTSRSMLESLMQYRWYLTIPETANPLILSWMLQASYVWNRTWAIQLVKRIQIRRVNDRLSMMRSDDLRALPRFIQSLRVLQEEAYVEDVLGIAEDLGTDRIGASLPPDASAALLRQRLFAPNSRLALCHGVSERLTKELKRPLVLDRSAYWTGIGNAAAALHAEGRGDLVPQLSDAVHGFDGVAEPYLWAQCWLPDASRDADAMQRALDQHRHSAASRQHPDRRAMALIAGLRTRTLEMTEVVEDEILWGQVANASLRYVAILREMAQNDAELAAWFDRLRPALSERLRSPAMAFYDGYADLADMIIEPSPQLDLGNL